MFFCVCCLIPHFTTQDNFLVFTVERQSLQSPGRNAHRKTSRKNVQQVRIDTWLENRCPVSRVLKISALEVEIRKLHALLKH